MQYHQKTDKLHGNIKYRAEHVREWRKLMKEHRWNQVKLSQHLGIGKNLISKLLQAEAYGELP